jgi:hypothetical protein
MAVSGELLCSFELLKPLDSSALKSHIKKSRNQRKTILNSPVRIDAKIWLTERDALSGPYMYIKYRLTDFCSLQTNIHKVTNMRFLIIGSDPRG